jgi:hypothetical protein
LEKTKTNAKAIKYGLPVNTVVFKEVSNHTLFVKRNFPPAAIVFEKGGFKFRQQKAVYHGRWFLFFIGVLRFIII